jgi:hypothetical protein
MRPKRSQARGWAEPSAMRSSTSMEPIQKQGSKEFMVRKLPVPSSTGATMTAAMARACAGRRPPNWRVSRPVSNDGDAMGGEAEDSNPGGRSAEERFSEAGLQSDHGSLVDVAPGEVAAADEEVHIVAEVAVAEVHAPERTEEMDEKDGDGKGGGKEEGRAQRRSLGDGRMNFG